MVILKRNGLTWVDTIKHGCIMPHTLASLKFKPATLETYLEFFGTFTFADTPIYINKITETSITLQGIMWMPVSRMRKYEETIYCKNATKSWRITAGDIRACLVYLMDVEWWRIYAPFCAWYERVCMQILHLNERQYWS